MTTPFADLPDPATAPAFPLPAPTATPGVAEELDPAPGPRAGSRYIWLQILGQFGVFVAYITPMAISLAIQLGKLAPGHEEYLGYITGSGSLVVMLVQPLMGVLSDRTRSRFGRRKPFMVGGMLVGILALLVMALAPSVLVLGLGWVLAQLSWGQVFASLTTSTADNLSEDQRGKVSGLAGFATQVAPVFGVVIAGRFAADALKLFLVPGAVGVLFVTLFVLFTRDPDSSGMVVEEKLSLRTIFGKFVYDPRQHPDFSWVWLSRFLFYFGLTLNTTFTAFFIAQKLGVSVAAVAPTLATLSMLGLLTTTLGAIGGGFLSDRLHRRRVFVLAAATLFSIGAVIMGVAPSITLLIAGSLITSVGVGMFAAVDQALILDVLPERATSAGRFMAIGNFSIQIPQSIAPFVAPVILAIGSGADKNYALLYIVAGIFTLVSGLVVLRVRSVN